MNPSNYSVWTLLVLIVAMWLPFSALLRAQENTPDESGGLSSGETLTAVSLPPQQSDSQAPADTSGLRIVVIEGEDGVNIIQDRTVVRPVVEVRDRNNTPVSGAVVLFSLPQEGAGAVFANGESVFSLMTDASGRATAAGFTPLGEGSFEISVQASYQDQTASTTITQSNFTTVAAAQSGGAGAGFGGAAGAGGAGTGSGGIRRF